jgi:hypothetical protein
LIINCCEVDDEGAEALAKNKSMTSLDVASNDIGKKGIKALMENSTLTFLDTGHNPGSGDVCEDLEEMWDRKTKRVKEHSRLGSLLSLIFSSNGLTANNLPTIPFELERIIWDYCKPEPFDFRNVVRRVNRKFSE